MGTMTVGTAGTNGYYRNASGEIDGNFIGTDFRSLGLTNQCLALQLFGPHFEADMNGDGVVTITDWGRSDASWPGSIRRRSGSYSPKPTAPRAVRWVMEP